MVCGIGRQKGQLLAPRRETKKGGAAALRRRSIERSRETSLVERYSAYKSIALGGPIQTGFTSGRQLGGDENCAAEALRRG